MIWLLPLAGLVCYVFGVYPILKNTITDKYSRFRELNRLVGTQHTGTRYRDTFKVFCISSTMILKMFWVNFLQKINNSVEYPDKNFAIVSYVLDGRMYKVVVARRKGPVLVLTVKDENHQDVFNQIIPFLGPHRDWHGRAFSPDYWGKETLVFHLATGEIKSFHKHEVIKLK